MSDQSQRQPTRPSDLLEPVRVGQGAEPRHLDRVSRPVPAHHGRRCRWSRGSITGPRSAASALAPTADFESHTIAWQTSTVFFAVLDLVAAVGLWLAAAWGAVVWLTSVVSMAAVEVFFPQVYGGSIFVVFIEMTLLGVYLYLAIVSAREHGRH